MNGCRHKAQDFFIKRNHEGIFRLDGCDRCNQPVQVLIPSPYYSGDSNCSISLLFSSAILVLVKYRF